MTKRLPSKTIAMVLFTSVSASVMLSACTYVRRQIDYYSNDREPQSVDGQRRVPMFNPKMAPEESGMSQPAPSMKTQSVAHSPEQHQAPAEEMAAKHAPSYDESPYDYFDNEGNRVEPKQAETKEQEGNFFTQLFGGPSSDVERLRQEPRKPLMDNGYPTGAASAPKPAATEPVEDSKPSHLQPWQVKGSESESLGMKRHVEKENNPSSMDVTTYHEPAENEIQAASGGGVHKTDEKSWFDRMTDDVGDALSSDEASAKEPARAADESYPKLSSVPQKPKAFGEMQADKDQDMQELQNDLQQAKQNSQDLYAEPSSQDAMVPVEPANPPSKPVTMEKSAAVPAKDKQPEVMLGHVTDSADSEAASDSSEALPQPEMQQDHAPASAAVKTGEKEPAWWEGWNLFSSKRYTDEQLRERIKEAEGERRMEPVNEDEDQQPDQEQQAEKLPWASEPKAAVVKDNDQDMRPAAELMDDEEDMPEAKPAVQELKPVVAEPKPEGKVPPAKKLALPTHELKPLVETTPASGSQESVAVPVPTDAYQDEQKASSDDKEDIGLSDGAVGTLPPTQLLHQYKTLPPSRYSGRRATY